MKTYKMRVLQFLLFMVLACKSPYNKKVETSFEREKRMIGEYEKQTIKEKGNLTYYIPKEHVHWYFNENKFHSINNVQKNDNVCFFDSTGNIVYQALVEEYENSEITLKCLDLKKAEYYYIKFNQGNLNNIRDLDKSQMNHYLVMFYSGN